MEQPQVTTRPAFLEKWTFRLNLGVLIGIGASLIGIIIFFFLLMAVAVGNGDGTAPQGAFVEVVKALLGFFTFCFNCLLFIAVAALPIINALYLRRYRQVTSKKKRIFLLVILVATAPFLVLLVILAMVAGLSYLTK